MQKLIKSSTELRDKLKKGVDTVADSVKVTLGPKGRVVIIDDGYTVKCTKDGVSVAKAIKLDDAIENTGAKLVIQSATSTNDVTGDGTTTATVLTQAILNEGIFAINSGANPVGVKKGMDQATDHILKRLDKLAVNTDNDPSFVKSIAMISSNNDEVIGSLISEAVNKIGKEGIITMEKSMNSETYVDIVNGMKVDYGFDNSSFINNPVKGIVDYNKPNVLLINDTIDSIGDIYPVLQEATETQEPLIIISNGMDNQVLQTILLNRIKGNMKVATVSIPRFVPDVDNLYADIAAMINSDIDVPVTEGELNHNEAVYGKIDNIKIDSDSLTIINKKEGGRLEERIQLITDQIKENETPELKKRLARLTGGVAVIYVGAVSELEMKEKLDRVEDALNATTSALDEGIVEGGGNALYHLKRTLDDVRDKAMTRDEKTGITVIQNSLSAPFMQILYNAGLEPVTIINGMKANNLGYDVNNDRFVNLIEKGIIDPVKVTKTALKNATSIASMILLTESCVINNNL